MVINLACGKKLVQGAINVDVMDGEGVDVVSDLFVYLNTLKNGSVDKIYASHIVEHFADQKAFFDECIRVLRVGGVLRITAPHASCIPSVGCMGHYRTYSLYTFNDYLCKPWYMFKTPKFVTVNQHINWWYEKSGSEVPRILLPIISALDCVISFTINLAPRIYENFFAGIIPSREIIWEGKKI